MKLYYIACILIPLLNIQADDLNDISLEDLLNTETELKADVGSRNGSRNLLETPAPVDVITYKQIEKSGLTSLNDVLRYFVSGFNSPETSVADGTDHVRVFTLRGMGSDQVLVLINGKRLHTSALLNVNGTIGRGSSNVDLDTIAVNSIDKIEILRDGAAAQYGSDAIAGVINIILKGDGHKNNINFHTGIRSKGDGKKVQSDMFITKKLDYDGFVNISLMAQSQEQTQRTGTDVRKNASSKLTHVGIPDAKSFAFVLNSEIPLENTTTLYANGIFNYRDSKSSAFSRVSDEEHPDGFLPIINATILDYSATFGANGELSNGYYWDISNVYGSDTIKFNVSGSYNYDLGTDSPTYFNNGSLIFIQDTINIDIKKSFSNIDLAFGTEYRYENYQIKSGDEASYILSGSQGFAGYRPENETDSSRNNYALYIDSIYHFQNKKISLENALRYENYSDFGDTTNVKLLLTYQFLEELFFRVSTSTGFRAPSLAQSHYSHTSTFGGLVKGTFTPDHPVSQAFGAKDLKAEKSKHFSVGSVYHIGDNFNMMLDYFYTDVDDKIVLSSNLVATNDEQKAVLDAYGVSEARFFTNALNTETQGIDLKINYKYLLKDNSQLDFSFWYNYNKTKIVSYNNKSSTNNANPYEQLDVIENGQPKDSVHFLINYKKNKFDTTLNFNRYGSYQQVIDNQAYKFKAQLTTDLDISYKMTNDIDIAIGGNNIFDVVPNKWNGLVATQEDPFYGYNGIKPYSRYSPFGYSGAYYYIRMSIKF